MVKKISLIVFIIVAISTAYVVYTYYAQVYRALAPAVAPADKKLISDSRDDTNLGLSLEPGYRISIFADKLEGPRDLIQDQNGTILVSLPTQGKVIALPNSAQVTVVDGLNYPHGLAFDNDGKLYIAEGDQVSSYDYDKATYKVSNKKKIVDLPTGGNHVTRSIHFSPSGKLLISIGSSCNSCIEKDQRRASILSVNKDGSGLATVATGLRNSVFMTTNPVTKEVWATDMGRDNLGDNIPFDEVNVIKEGQMYGWPFCYNNQEIDQEMNKGGLKFDCKKSQNPKVTFQAHSAPLGLAFYPNREGSGNDLLVSFHGSWNRSIPTGYKVVRVTLDSKGNPTEQEDFITGWLKGDTAVGRPVDILVDKGNKIYISDDKGGAIYLVENMNLN